MNEPETYAVCINGYFYINRRVLPEGERATIKARGGRVVCVEPRDNIDNVPLTRIVGNLHG